MSAHIFLVNQDNFRKTLTHGVYGATKVQLPRVNAEVIAGMQTIRRGDFIFFYVRKSGVHGLWKATTSAFLDESLSIWGASGKYPYAVCFEPVIRDFPAPVALSDVFDLRDTGKLWTFDLGMLSNKNHYPITNDEARALIRLLLRNNPVAYPPKRIQQPHGDSGMKLPLLLTTNRKGELDYEGYLNAWFVRSFAAGSLKSLVGEYQEFLNFVPTSFNRVMDIFLTHSTNVDGIDILHKFTCMELKTKVGTDEDLKQLVRYEDWLARKLAGGDHQMVQCILVSFDFQEEALDYVRRRRKVEEKTVRLVRYRVDAGSQNIVLDEVE